MALQNITFKHTNSETDSRIHEFVRQKLSILDKYIKPETEARAEVEFEKIPSHKTGAICRVEVNVWLAGTLYRAEETQQTFEAAIDVVKDQLDQEMRRATEKHTSLLRRGGRKLKEMMRFGE